MSPANEVTKETPSSPLPLPRPGLIENALYPDEYAGMTHALATLTVILLLGMVLTRVAFLRTRGMVATKFGAIDKTDFLIPPFALFYFYLIVASALHWPSPLHSMLFSSAVVAGVGVGLCAGGLVLLAVSLVAFGSSFRIGIDMDRPDKLVTSGVFAYSRNPIYVAFAMVLTGEFLILPHWVLLLYLFAGILLFHRQVLREEAYLTFHYGSEYQAYRKRVRRYL
jgi:protein-S-isoprenylcysteine O-methyltransferase Ste14